MSAADYVCCQGYVPPICGFNPQTQCKVNPMCKNKDHAHKMGIAASNFHPPGLRPSRPCCPTWLHGRFSICSWPNDPNLRSVYLLSEFNYPSFRMYRVYPSFLTPLVVKRCRVRGSASVVKGAVAPCAPSVRSVSRAKLRGREQHT